MNMMLMQACFTSAVLQLHVKTNQAYLITAGFLHNHSYECKNLLLYQEIVISFRGGGLPLDPTGVTAPRPPLQPPISLPEIFLALSVK